MHDALPGRNGFLRVKIVALHVAAGLWHWHRRDGMASRMGLPEGPAWRDVAGPDVRTVSRRRSRE